MAAVSAVPSKGTPSYDNLATFVVTGSGTSMSVTTFAANQIGNLLIGISSMKKGTASDTHVNDSTNGWTTPPLTAQKSGTTTSDGDLIGAWKNNAGLAAVTYLTTSGNTNTWVAVIMAFKST
jgi:hypothetical protein